MAKECTFCKTINHSAANHCSFCGKELPDKELSVEDKLRLELINANSTIENLNKIIAENQVKLTNEEDENIKLRNLVSENDCKHIEITKQLTKKKKIKTLYIILFFIPIILCVGFSIWINKLNVIISDSKTDKINISTQRTTLQEEIDTKKNTMKQEITHFETDKNMDADTYNQWVDYVNCYYTIKYIDKKKSTITNQDFIDSYTPRKNKFENEVKAYQDIYKPYTPKLTIYDVLQNSAREFSANTKVLWKEIEKKKNSFDNSWNKEQIIQTLITLPVEKPSRESSFDNYLKEEKNKLEIYLKNNLPDVKSQEGTSYRRTTSTKEKEEATVNQENITEDHTKKGLGFWGWCVIVVFALICILFLIHSKQVAKRQKIISQIDIDELNQQIVWMRSEKNKMEIRINNLSSENKYLEEKLRNIMIVYKGGKMKQEKDQLENSKVQSPPQIPLIKQKESITINAENCETIFRIILKDNEKFALFSNKIAQNEQLCLLWVKNVLKYPSIVKFLEQELLKKPVIQPVNPIQAKKTEDDKLNQAPASPISSDTIRYADTIIDGYFNRISETPNDDTIFELHLQNTDFARFSIYHSARQKIFANPSFLEGCNKQVLSNAQNLTIENEGTAQRKPEDGRWQIKNNLKIILK